jgi:RNA-directed DNA polymerase
MNTVSQPMYEWQDLPWRTIERAVFKLQKRIYRAAKAGDIQRVHKLQRLLLKSWSARCLAVRRVTQDNQGKNTAGVDGVRSLQPERRLQLAQTLRLTSKAQPTRRVWIPKPGKAEKRPLGIPTLRDRAEQALAKLALEPEWEAHFEPNSYGFRPGRSCHDAIDAIFNAVCHKPKYVLDADIAQCFDRIDHDALLSKLHTSPTLRRAIRAWLKAGVMEKDELFPTTAGTPQGGVISPLLANIALHGLETAITQKHPQAKVIRYADDLVVLHPDLTVVEQIQQTVANWLAPLGLELKPSKTRITHTLNQHDGPVGFDFLGFHIRQYKVGRTHSAKSTGRHPKLLGFKTIIKPSKTALKRHQQALHTVIRTSRSAPQARLIGQLNPIIKGWTAYYSTVCSKATFGQMAYLMFLKLRRWAYRRHPTKTRTWVVHKYWRLERNCWDFAPPNGKRLYQHAETPIRRHTKVQGCRSPYDGDWLYWSKRNRQQPGTPRRVTTLLYRQKGQCARCGLYFRAEDKLQVDHIIPTSQGGWDGYTNWQLLHAHCHHCKTAQENRQGRLGSACDKSQSTEEPCEAKVSRTVLKPSGGGDSAT